MAGTPSTRPGTLLPRLVRGAAAGLLLAVGVHATALLAGGNFHAVLPGQVYRCAQPGPAAIARYVRRHGIRTVVNLRGCCPPAPWYRDEARAAAGCGASLEDIPLAATRLPSPQAVRDLVRVIDESEGPILFHCQQGADRTGLASALAVLLKTDATLDAGLRHLGLRTGHLCFGRTGNVDRFFELYAAYLAGANLAHSPDVLRRWVREGYCPAEARADFTVASPAIPGGVLRLERGKGRLLVVRCRNRSAGAWRFEPGPTAGVHLYWAVTDDRTGRWAACGRTGLRRAVVGPGESIDLEVAVPGLAAGAYTLLADLNEDRHGSFVARGNVPVVVEVRVQ